jgi:hypothetical protein
LVAVVTWTPSMSASTEAGRGPIVRGLGFEPLGSKPIDDRVRDRALVLDHHDLLLLLHEGSVYGAVVRQMRVRWQML